MKRLVSACLVGINCKYDGLHNYNAKVVALGKHDTLIPVCPEQLGGLSSPRSPHEQKDGKVVTPEGEDHTEHFQRGARETLKIARLCGATEAVFKQRSPSCGVGQIYDGCFCRKVIKGDGMTTALLRSEGIRVISEEEISRTL
jgi:uncharacterized protein YbbK (DUF523 family)